MNFFLQTRFSFSSITKTFLPLVKGVLVLTKTTLLYSEQSNMQGISTVLRYECNFSYLLPV